MLRTRSLFALVLGVAALGGAVLSANHDARAATGLVKGWNNVAFLGQAGPPSEGLAPIDGKYNAVYRWNTTKKAYDVYAPGLPSWGNSLTELNAGDALWIDLTAESGALPQSVGGSGGGAGSGHLSIAASTFQPASDLAIYEKTFNQLNPVGTDEYSQRYYAPIILPDGVTITSMTAAFEASGGTVQVRLDYTPIANGTNTAQIYKLVEVLSTSGSSPQTAAAFAHTVNNNANVYFLVVDLTGGSGAKLRGVSIAYDGS